MIGLDWIEMQKSGNLEQKNLTAEETNKQKKWMTKQDAQEQKKPNKKKQKKQRKWACCWMVYPQKREDKGNSKCYQKQRQWKAKITVWLSFDVCKLKKKNWGERSISATFLVPL